MSWTVMLNYPSTSPMTVNWNTIWHDIKLHRRDLGLAWQAGCHTQAPYGAGPYQGVCGTAVAKYTRGAVAGAPLNQDRMEVRTPKEGHGKGTFLIRQEGLPKQNPHHKKSQVMSMTARGCLRGMDQPWANFVCVCAHVAYVFARWDYGRILTTRRCTIHDW
jgi:hypothetical protein